MSHYRKNSVRDKVIGKKWIYSERNTLHRQSGGAIAEGKSQNLIFHFLIKIFLNVGVWASCVAELRL